MPYAVISDIRAALPHIKIDAGSRPTSSEVESWCQLVSAELDAITANLGYQTPITGTNSLLMMKEMVKDAVAAKVLRSHLAGVRDPDTLGARGFIDSFKSRLEKLQSPTCGYMLSDAVKLNVQDKVSVIAKSMVSEDSSFYDEVRLTRDQVF